MGFVSSMKLLSYFAMHFYNGPFPPLSSLSSHSHSGSFLPVTIIFFTCIHHIPVIAATVDVLDELVHVSVVSLGRQLQCLLESGAGSQESVKEYGSFLARISKFNRVYLKISRIWARLVAGF